MRPQYQDLMTVLELFVILFFKPYKFVCKTILFLQVKFKFITIIEINKEFKY